MPRKLDTPAQVAKRSMCAGCEGRAPKKGEEEYASCLVCATAPPKQERPAA